MNIADPVASVNGVRTALARDAYGFEILQDLDELPEAPAASLLRHRAAVLFKPETIKARRVDDGFTFLAGHGFRPIMVTEVPFNRNLVRAFWSASPALTRPTRAFCAVLDAYLISTPWLFALLDAVVVAPEYATASRRLASLKGPSAPDARRPGQLRWQLTQGNATALFTFAHAADDEVQFVRELAMFFGVRQRSALLDAAAAAREVDPAPHIDALYRRHAPHDLDLGRAVDRIVRAGQGRVESREVRVWCDAAARGELAWLRLVELLAGADVDPWDLIVFGAAVTALPARAPDEKTAGGDSP